MTPPDGAAPAADDMAQAFAVLRALAPPALVVHAGAGAGEGPLGLWRRWPVDRAVVLDADARRLAWARTLAKSRPWLVQAVVLGPQDGESLFFTASNPAESGLLSPELCTGLWPNLRLCRSAPCPTRRLDRYLEAAIPGAGEPLWCLVDCFPALAVLRGAEGLLDRCGVVGARVVLDARMPGLGEASLEAVDAFLAAHGFCRVCLAAGLHPAVGAALFARDWPRDMARLHRERAALDAALERTRAEGAAGQAALGRVRAEGDDLRATLERTRAEDDDLRTVLERTRAEGESLRTALERARLENEAVRAALKQTQGERDGMRAALRQTQAERDLAATRSEASRTALERTQAERDHGRQRLAEAEAMLCDLSQRQAEAAGDRETLRQELARAEAQLELLKDLLQPKAE